MESIELRVYLIRRQNESETVAQHQHGEANGRGVSASSLSAVEV